MNGKKQVSGLIKFIPFICTSATWGLSFFLVPLFPFPSSSAITVRRWQHHLDSSLGNLIHIWRLETADGCDISYLWKWQEIFSFHSTSYLRCIHHFFFSVLGICHDISLVAYVSILLCQWILSFFFFFKSYLQLFLLWVSVKIFFPRTLSQSSFFF